VKFARGLIKFLGDWRATNVSSPRGLPIVAIQTADLAGYGDRATLSEAAERADLELHAAGSCEEAWHIADRLHAPVILYDRDIRDTEWREAVGVLSALPHRPMVILVSPVADEHLWSELFRIGGFDVLQKPLRADDISRVLALALSYWHREAGRGGTPASVRRTG
jgi:DNA-binding NtrC family response regulator